MRTALLPVLLFLTLPLLASGSDEPARQGIFDPAIAEEDGVFYVFATGEGIPVLVSRDLARWDRIGPALPDGPDLLAPEVARFGGRWHLYYVVPGGRELPDSIGHAVSAALDPKREDHGFVAEDVVVQGNVGGPCVAADGKGRPWLFVTDGRATVRAVRLDPETGEPVWPATVAFRGEAGRRISSPTVVRRGSRYHLLFTEGHAVFAVAADSIEGPYRAIASHSLLLGDSGPWRSPGEVDALVTKTGDVLVGSALDTRVPALSLAVWPLLWPGEGSPVAGEEGTIDAWRGRPPDRAEVAGFWMHSVDYAREADLYLRASGEIGGQPEGARWDLAGAVLSMHWPRDDAPDGTWVDRCLVSSDARWYVGRNQQGMVIRGRSLSQTATPRQTSHGAPIREMPAGVPAPPGELSLFADFGSARDGKVDLYLVNRTREWVVADATDNRVLVATDTRVEGGAWIPGEVPGMVDDMLVPPILNPGAYFRFSVRLPPVGPGGAVRYRFPGPPSAVSNEGR